ncbi:MAG: uracil-DNA glycosylase [Chloroflexi bacterium]|nr:uracil-DNA glycosylase [Chloroflexota bacterium]
MIFKPKGPQDLEQLTRSIQECRKCPRLVEWREQVGRVKRRAYLAEDYWAKPVPGFGDPQARILVVGLAPGAHGSNRTGRMFTGDESGNFLFPALWRAGFASLPCSSKREDGLELKGIWITAVCRCVPPDNKPNRDEINQCRSFLDQELAFFTNLKGIVALGKVAFDEVIKYRIFGQNLKKILIFKHGGFIPTGIQQPWILASYHPSRQNTQTGRLTQGMFDQIWKKVNQLLLD